MKTVKYFFLTTLIVLFIVSCGRKSDKAVEVSEKQDIDALYEDADVFFLDTQQSQVLWIGSKVVGKHDGTIHLKEGKVYMKDGELIGGKVVIDMTTIVVLDIKDEGTNATLKQHLESDDFFSTATYPTAMFEIAQVEKEDELHKITGNLTIKDITHAITFQTSIAKQDGKYIANADFDIDRTRWDIRYGSGKFFDKLGDNMIHDLFNIRLQLITK